MAKYQWSLAIQVSADDEVEAEELIGDAIELAMAEPDGIISLGAIDELKDWPCRYCKHLVNIAPVGKEYIGRCDFELQPDTCGKFEQYQTTS